LEFGIHVADVQRDYVFGWFLFGVNTATTLKDVLILKGGNCFRKAYFPNTRFSYDIDFPTTAGVDEAAVMAELNKACRFVQDQAGVIFDYGRSQIRVQKVARVQPLEKDANNCLGWLAVHWLQEFGTERSLTPTGCLQEMIVLGAMPAISEVLDP
jgi:Nucleotidyl transferase AbiEii toxin, Type IV TA system